MYGKVMANCINVRSKLSGEFMHVHIVDRKKDNVEISKNVIGHFLFLVFPLKRELHKKDHLELKEL